jgi:heme-degrading monooxygenase HmoA
VLITVIVPGDTEAFRAFAAEHPDRLKAIADRGREMGAIHHRFAIGDGTVLVVDEWNTAEAFQSFFEGNEEIAAVMQNAGASGPPQVTVYEALETSDQF